MGTTFQEVGGAGAVPPGGQDDGSSPVKVGGVTAAGKRVNLLLDAGGGALLVTTGGASTAAVNAGATGAPVVIKAGPGRLCRIVVTALGTALINIYDNASAASGTILFTIPASAAAGTIYDVQMPAALGIVAGNAANTPALTVSYS